VRRGGVGALVYSFRPRLIPTLAAALLIALTVWLGRWQAHRAEEKVARHEMLEARQREAPLRLTGPVPSAEPLLYRKLTAAGEWLPAGQVFVDNQTHGGRAGFHVVTPLRIRGSDAVLLVNRGWIARGREYPQAPWVEVPAGPVEVAGSASLPPARYLELSAEGVTGNVFQNLSIDRYRAAMKLPVLPFVLLADVPAPGLQPVRDTPRMGADKHREYSLTWFSLAATAFVLWIAMNLRRRG
jgi:surfeit locus 1 family protein